MEGSSTWPADRIAELLGTAVRRLSPLGGGFGRPYRVDLAGGQTVFAKTQRDAPAGFFAHEAEGLRWLAAAEGGARVPRVLAEDPEMVIVEWVAPGTPNPEAALDFGRRLAITHDAGADHFGRERDTMIASEPLPGGARYSDWPTFYAEARLRPFLDRAVERGSIGDHDRQAVEAVIAQVDELTGPDEAPARLHGDLWSGNVLWSPPGATMIDPAAYGGHREVDLAMLSLFGLPHLEQVIIGYQQQHPLAGGWQRRIPLYQLFPLLVHAVIFGGSYGAAAGDAARRALTGDRS